MYERRGAIASTESVTCNLMTFQEILVASEERRNGDSCTFRVIDGQVPYLNTEFFGLFNCYANNPQLLGEQNE